MTDGNDAPSPGLVSEVSAILYAADPVGINFGVNPDEYDTEAETIVAGLPEARSHADVVILTHATFVLWFDEEIADLLRAMRLSRKPSGRFGAAIRRRRGVRQREQCRKRVRTSFALRAKLVRTFWDRDGS